MLANPSDNYFQGRNKGSRLRNLSVLGATDLCIPQRRQPFWWGLRIIESRTENFRNFERPFTPRGWLRSAPNFGKTRFGWFPTFHFSTLKKKLTKFFCKKNRHKIQNGPFWRSYEFLSVTGKSVSKNDPRRNHFQVCTSFGRGVKRPISLTFRPKRIRRSCDGMMILCYDDIWYDYIMTIQ